MATSIYEDGTAARSGVAFAGARPVTAGEAGTPPIKVMAFFGALTAGPSNVGITTTGWLAIVTIGGAAF